MNSDDYLKAHILCACINAAINEIAAEEEEEERKRQDEEEDEERKRGDEEWQKTDSNQNDENDSEDVFELDNYVNTSEECKKWERHENFGEYSLRNTQSNTTTCYDGTIFAFYQVENYNIVIVTKSLDKKPLFFTYNSIRKTFFEGRMIVPKEQSNHKFDWFIGKLRKEGITTDKDFIRSVFHDSIKFQAIPEDIMAKMRNSR